MSQSEHLCSAVLEQGVKKGEQCDRPKLDNGYCGKHQKQAELIKAKESGLRKCSTHRCTITFIPNTTKNIEYCELCKKNKDEYIKTIILCKWNKLECKKAAKDSGFCGKHEPRAILLKESLEKSIRICDDGKRACKNKTIDNKLKCESCLEKDRNKDKIRYMKKQDNLHICLGCGTEITDLLEGIKGDKVQRCKSCYEKLRTTELNRPLRNRNYSIENKINIDKYLVSYIQSARNRNIAFDLTKEQFTEIIELPCYYCAFYKDDEVIGIDRINSDKNYTLDNCVPCCKTCNFMKGTLSKRIFIIQAHKIAIQNPVEDISDSEDEAEKTLLSSMIAPLKVAEMYRNGKFNLYIEACIRDKRSPLFIERLKTIENNKLTYREFREFFRTCCKTDSKLCSNNIAGNRQRLSLKEIYGYFNNKNSEYGINLYESIHGKMDGFKEDMEIIADNWDSLSFDERTSSIHKVIIKYRNKKANTIIEYTSP
jgi:ribosomal protein L34E